MKTMHNAVTLGGNLGTSLKVKQVGSGKRLLRFTLATDEYYKDNQGETKKKTEWHRLVAWDETADRMARDIAKGMFVIVHGKLVNNKFLDKNGDAQYRSEVLVQTYARFKSAGRAAAQNAA